MDLSQVVLDFVHQNGLATAIIVFSGWFLVGKVWPWYTKDYLPAASAREDNRDKVIIEVRDAMLEIKALTTQLISTMQQQDAVSRELATTINSNQQVIVNLLRQTQPEGPSKN